LRAISISAAADKTIPPMTSDETKFNWRLCSAVWCASIFNMA